MLYLIGAGTDPGKQQKRNEDSIFAARNTCDLHLSPLPLGLFVVADGLGAYTDGREASRCTVQAIVDCIWPEIVKNKDFRLEECSALLTKAIQSANEVVRQQNINLHSKPNVDIDVGVSTTVTAMMIVDSVAYIANVGNCRTYIYHRDSRIKQVTIDHSAVTQLIQSGHMISEKSASSLQGNRYMRSPHPASHRNRFIRRTVAVGEHIIALF